MNSVLFSLFTGLVTDGLAGKEMTDACISLVNGLLLIVTSPISYNWATAFTCYFEGVALLVAIGAVAVKGARMHFETDQSSIQYVIRSIWPIAFIAASPTIFSFVVACTGHLISDLSGTISSIPDYKNLVGLFTGKGTGNGSTAMYLLRDVFFVIAVFFTAKVLFQCVKRQIQVAVVAIIGPLYCAMIVSENNAGDVLTIFKEIVGTGVTTVLQLALLMTAMSLPAAISGGTLFAGMDVDIAVLYVVAFLGAITHVEKWVERYALAPTVSGSGSVSRMAVGYVLHGGYSTSNVGRAVGGRR